MSSALPGRGRVQRVVENGCASWTVIGADRRPVAPVEAFLRWLTDIERSPNTVRAYAGDLRQFWEFLELRGYDWSDLGLEELGDFAGWLRSPAENVVVLPSGVPARGASTVNRKLAAVAAFYDFHHRQSGVPVAERLGPPSHRSGRGSFKPMLLRVRAAAAARATGAAARSVGGCRACCRSRRWRRSCARSGGCVIGSCSRCCSRRGCGSGRRSACATRTSSRGRTGSRSSAARTTPTARAARAARGACRSRAALMRLYARVHARRVRLARFSDYVFVNLWGGRVGRPLTYATVNDIVVATRRTVGFHFTAHWFRHTYATLQPSGGGAA